MVNSSIATPSSAATNSQSSVYRKIAIRIIPFLMLCYVGAYLDRINIGFAKLQMLDSMGFSNAVFGLGAGLFFIGYLIFEVPSNLYMLKIGAKKTISRIMILWAIISASLAFVETPTQFYIARFLLGAAEAGFYPGIMLYLTFWFPATHRGKIIALFASAIPLSGLIGAPLSGAILEVTHGMRGMAGWQWMFLLEAIPSAVLGLLCLKCLADKPENAPWLTESERSLVVVELSAERARVDKDASTHSLVATLKDRRVWIMVLICFCQAVCTYGISFWLPTLVQQLLVGDARSVGFFTAIPFLVAVIVMNLVGRSSDKHRERRWHLAAPFLCVGLGLVSSTFFSTSIGTALLCLSIAAAGAYTTTAIMFSIPGLFLSGVGMAAGIALINCLGGLGGFLSPYLVGLVKDATGSTDYGVYAISAIAVIGAMIALTLPRKVVNR
jgi:D-galactonate transporter